jgi:CubicO group peptidase (beta-lactamase class C family)
LKKIKWFFGLLSIGLLLLAYFNYPKLNLISGYASKNMASNVFLAQRSSSTINEIDHDMPLIKLANEEINKSENTASASVYGLMERKSVFKKGLGAVLTNKEFSKHNFTIVPERQIRKDTLPFPYGNLEPIDTIFKNVDYNKLDKVISEAINDAEQNTRSILVVYKDRIIDEEYGQDITIKTPVLGWSMTKSILATLYGILEYQGVIQVNDKAPIPEWQSDERKDITLDNLLRMQSGLAWEEDYFKISDVTKMLFLNSDMTLSQKNNLPVAKPTEVWNYSSGTTNLLSGIARSYFKDHQAYLNFPYSQLIDKLGMHSMVLETDLVGNYVGSSYGWATTRDWAKFGLLYLKEGMWNGERLFAKSWVDYVVKPTVDSNGTYGAHFWLNANGKYPDLPRDLYSANGFQGQRVFIFPSHDIVVVRTGLEEQSDEAFNYLLKEILSTIK